MVLFRIEKKKINSAHIVPQIEISIKIFKELSSPGAHSEAVIFIHDIADQNQTYFSFGHY